jgi:hypothetical protein
MLTLLPGSERLDGKGMHAALELTLERLIDHAVALDSALSFERIRHDINAEMALSSRLIPCVSCVPVRVVSDLKLPRGKSPGQFLCDQIAPAHRLPIRAPLRRVNAGLVHSELTRRVGMLGRSTPGLCQVLNEMGSCGHTDRS